jgi:hypothetical protein
MTNARFWLAAVVLAGAVLAACSGNFGAGTSTPGGIIPSGPLGPAATASPTPSSVSAILNYGQSADLQPLPPLGGYGGAIAFPVPSPRLSDVLPIGVTVSVGPPPDTPDLNLQTNSKSAKRRTRRGRPARPLFYIALLPTRDITLATYPRLAIDVPRNVVTVYREDELGIALFNPADKDTTYRLGVAALDLSSPPPAPLPSGATPSPASSGTPTAGPSASPSPSPSPTVSLLPGQTPPARTVTPTPGASPTAKPTLPPERILFAGRAGPLKLQANKATVFAVYALPVATPSPSATSAAAAGSPAAATASPAAPSPAASTPSPPASPAASPSSRA